MSASQRQLGAIVRKREKRIKHKERSSLIEICEWRRAYTGAVYWRFTRAWIAWT